MINTLISLTVNGLAMGIMYALVAMGLILLVKAVGVMNFAQGDLLMLGAYISSALILDLKLPFWVFVPTAMICFAVVGIIFMVTTYWPLREASYPQAVVIATMGAGYALKEIVQIVWGPIPRVVPSLIRDSQTGKAAMVTLFGANLQWQFVLVFVVCAALIGAIFLLFEKSYVGRMMQAAAQNKYAAELLGIPTILTIAATYILVNISVSTAGFMIAPIYFVSPALARMQLRAFAGVVLGGFGSLKGAIYGSLIIGLIESFSTLKWSEYKDAVVFLVLTLVLIVRPQGIFGEKVGDKV